MFLKLQLLYYYYHYCYYYFIIIIIIEAGCCHISKDGLKVAMDAHVSLLPLERLD